MRFLRLVADRGRIVSTLALAMAFVVAIAGVAAAQEGPTRPFKGLFGGNERKQDGKQTLDVTASLQGGRDSDVLGLDASQAMDPRYQLGGEFASTNVGISYSAATAERGIAVSARALSEMRYSPAALPQNSLPAQEGALGLALGRTFGFLSLGLQQSATYFPYRTLMMFPRLPLVEGEARVNRSGSDFALMSNSVYGLNSDATAGFLIGRRTRFNFNVRRNQSIYEGAAGKGRDSVDQSVGGYFSHQFSRYASLRLGYAYRMSDYARSTAAPTIVSRNIDAGIDYRRPISVSRKTSISFNTGSTGTSDGYRTVYAATGGATLSHEIGRSWGTSLSYSRDLSFIDGYATPFMANGTSAQVSGYVGRRIDLGLTAGYSGGKNALVADRSRYESITGAGKFSLALNRYSNFYLQYFYYKYRLRNFEWPEQGVPPAMERRGLRGGITLWVPLLR